MRKIIIAAAFLVAFTACKNGKNVTETQVVSEKAVTENIAGGMSDVAYIQIDSLMVDYDLAEDLRTAFQNKYNKADRSLNAKYQKLERDMMDAQEKVQKGLVTRATAAELEQSLAKQQQDLMQSRDRMMGELSEEEQVMNNRIYHAIMDYLKEYNKDYKYSMIISTTASGPILHADPSMDITKEVLTELNKRYASEKAAESKKK